MPDLPSTQGSSGNPMMDLFGTGGLGQASGSQAQFGIFLQLIQRILAVLEGGGTVVVNAFAVYPITAAGDVNIAADYPDALAGIFSIRKTVSAATVVTLPPYGGPWGVCDGAGVAGTYNITVAAPMGYTINGQPSFLLEFNWQYATFILDGTNFVVGV